MAAAGQSFVYELLYEGQGQDGRPFVIGLVDEKLLRGATTETSRGEEAHFEGPSSPGRAPIELTPSPVEIAARPAPEAAFLSLAAARCEEALLSEDSKVSSYPAEAAKEKSAITPLPKPVRGNGRPVRRYFLRGA